MHLGESPGELIRRDGLARNLNAPGGLDPGGWGVKPRTNPRPTQSGFDHRAGRALPVGAADMDEATRAMRITEGFEHPRDPLQVELRGLDLVPERIKKANGFGVIHPTKALPRALLRTNITRPSRASSTVPPTTFNSNSQTDATPGGGTADKITAASEMVAPTIPAQRRPNLKPLAKI